MEERRLRLQEAANRCAPSRWAWVLGSRGRVGVPVPAACSPVLPLQEVLQSGCPDPRGAGAAGTLRSHPRVRAGPRESAGARLQLRGAGRGSCRPAGVGSSLHPRPSVSPGVQPRQGASHCGGPAVPFSKVSCPAGLAEALEGQAQEEPWGPIAGDQLGVPPAQVPGPQAPSPSCG